MIVKDPDVSALEQCPEALDSVGGSLVSHVLPNLVINPLMFVAEVVQAGISAVAVGVNRSAGVGHRS